MSGSIGGGASKDRSRSTTYNNAHLNGKNININARANATIEGGVVNASEELNLDVAGDLKVASLQDSKNSKSLGLNVEAGVGADGSLKSGSANANSSKGDYKGVNEQSGLIGGKVKVNVKGNTHLRGAKIDAKEKEGSSFSTGTLTTEDIENRASYSAMSGGVGYSKEGDKENNIARGLTPTIGMPTNTDKSQTTKTAISQNIQITITDKENQSQDISTISRDTQNAHHQMTEINTEVLDIRKKLSSEVAKDGFKAVGDYAMSQAEGDEAWEDGGAKKVLAHASMGALVATIGNGDSLSGAIGAGAREAGSNLTEGEDDATQQWASAVIGAVASGDATGASVAIDGEKYNRQLHQKEIEFLKDQKNIEGLAKELFGDNPTAEQMALAKKYLAQGGVSLVDKSYSEALNANSDKNIQRAMSYIKENYQGHSQLYAIDNDASMMDRAFGNDVVKVPTRLEVLDGAKLPTNVSSEERQTRVLNTNGGTTVGFAPSQEEYKDRYSNIDGYLENKDFYRENLNLATNQEATVTNFGAGVVKPLVDLKNAIEQDALGTAGAMVEGIANTVAHPIETINEEIRRVEELTDKADLDIMLGDNASASEHIGEATSGAVLSAVGYGAGKGIKSGAKGVKNALDGATDDLHIDALGIGGKGEISETLLSQKERIQLFNKELLEADKANNPKEALATIDKVMTEVEDRHSGVEAKENPGLKYEGRMYAPREDFTEKLSDGSLVATSKGNVVHLETDGTIKVYTKNSEGQADKLVLEKEGVNVDSNKVDLLTQNKEVLDDLHTKVTDELSDNKMTDFARDANGNQLLLPQYSSANPTVLLSAFKGARGNGPDILKEYPNPREKEFKEHILRDDNDIPAGIYSGHIMVSTDGGKTHYGYRPNVTDGSSTQDVIDYLQDKTILDNTYPGIITEDTKLFNDIMSKEYDNLGKNPIDMYQLEIPVSPEAHKSIEDSIKRGNTDYKYGFPPEGGNPNDFKDRKNCATFFGTCGLDLPYAGGKVRVEVIPGMENAGAKILDKDKYNEKK